MESKVQRSLVVTMAATTVSTAAGTMASFNVKAFNVADEWKNWNKQFQIYLLATNLNAEPDKRKVALLLHHMGPAALQIFNSFNLSIDEVKYNDLVAKFDSYFIPKINLAMERHAFFFKKTKNRGNNSSVCHHVGKSKPYMCVRYFKRKPP